MFPLAFPVLFNNTSKPKLSLEKHKSNDILSLHRTFHVLPSVFTPRFLLVLYALPIWNMSFSFSTWSMLTKAHWSSCFAYNVPSALHMTILALIDRGKQGNVHIFFSRLVLNVIETLCLFPLCTYTFTQSALYISLAR